MALLWVEGFEKFGAAGGSINPETDRYYNILSQKYVSRWGSDYTIQTGRNGGKCLRSLSTAEHIVTPDLGSTGDTLITGFAIKFRDYDANNWIVDFRHPADDGATVGWNQLALKTASVNSVNEVAVYRGVTLLDTSNGLALAVDTWYYLEMKVKCHDTNGTVNVCVDGVEVISFTGNTQHRYNDQYSRVMFRCNQGDNLFYDDWYVCDGSGITNNNFLGDCTVCMIDVTSDASGNWTPSTGVDMYAVIDEAVQDSDYISDQTSGNQAVFETSNLSGNVTTGIVQGVMVTCEAQQFDNCHKYPKFITQNGAGTIQDTGHFMPGGEDNPFAYTQIMELNPDGADWSISLVNDLRIGVEVS